MERKPQIKLERLEGIPFLEQIMKPHTAYYPTVEKLFGRRLLHGMAHITGGGIAGNLVRILPRSVDARIDLGRLRPPAIFPCIKRNGNIADGEMLSTFNCGVGMVMVASAADTETLRARLGERIACDDIGAIEPGEGRVRLEGAVRWE